jgi:hypothetical protein
LLAGHRRSEVPRSRLDDLPPTLTRGYSASIRRREGILALSAAWSLTGNSPGHSHQSRRYSSRLGPDRELVHRSALPRFVSSVSWLGRILAASVAAALWLYHRGLYAPPILGVRDTFRIPY